MRILRAIRRLLSHPTGDATHERFHGLTTIPLDAGLGEY